MKMSDYEIRMLNIIRDEVDAYLRSPNFGKSPEKSNIARTLSNVLPKITIGKTFDVRINKTSSSPFIMSIYPDINELDSKSVVLVALLDDPHPNTEEYVKTWCELKHWIIELDIRILLKDSPLCVRTGSEFVALLTHEIGHVMTEDPLTLIKNYKEKKAIYDKFNKLASSKSKFIRKMMLPMFVNTLPFRVVNRNNNSLHKEIAADAYVPDEYRGSLISYIEDCILKNPDASNIITTKEQNDNDQSLAIEFSKSSIQMMKDRMDVLKRQLTAQYNGCTGSGYQQELIKFLGKSVAGYDPVSESTNPIMENKLHTEYEKELAVCESEVQSVLEATKVTDRDLTILEVQCAEVKTTEDKIYLIHTIYDFIEAITKENEAKLKKTKDPKVKEFINNDARLKRLETCRDIVLHADTTDVGDQYGLFVRYPKGYEG